jgi:DNA-binding NarL/FixJ family response regulator
MKPAAPEPARRLVIADDESLALERLRRLMPHHPDWTVVGEATTGPETVALLEHLRPDVVLLDIRLPVEPITGSGCRAPPLLFVSPRVRGVPFSAFL